MLNHITFLPNPFAKFQFEKLDFLEIKAFEKLVEPFVVAYKFRCNKNRSTHPSISSFRPCNHPLWWSSFSQGARYRVSSLDRRRENGKCCFFHGSNDLVVRTTKIRDQWCTCRSKSRKPKDLLIDLFGILYSNPLVV